MAEEVAQFDRNRERRTTQVFFDKLEVRERVRESCFPSSFLSIFPVKNPKKKKHKTQNQESTLSSSMVIRTQ